MSNAAGAKASREEEIAFLIMENVLGVNIHIADAGAGNMKPDGAWIVEGAKGRRGIVESTSPPDCLGDYVGNHWALRRRSVSVQSFSCQPASPPG